MNYLETRRFIKEANRSGLSPIEKDVFQYYFSKTQNAEGTWYCPDRETAEEIYRSRNGVCAARRELIRRGWIREENGQFNIRILKSFSAAFAVGETVKAQSETRRGVENYSLKPEKAVSNETERGKSSVRFQTAFNDKRISGIEEKAEENIHTRHAPRGFPLRELYEAFPDIELTPAKIGFIEAEVKAEDKAAWLATIEIYKGNYDPFRQRYLPDKVGNLLGVFRSAKRNLERQKGRGDGANRANGNPERRAERAINDHNIVEQARARAEQRRMAKLHGSDAAGS